LEILVSGTDDVDGSRSANCDSIDDKEDHDMCVAILDDGDRTPRNVAANRKERSWSTTSSALSVDMADNSGATPLLVAAQENSQECMTILLRNGANVDKSDHDGHRYVKHCTSVAFLLLFVLRLL
jgi:ankyrin repeat protein